MKRSACSQKLGFFPFFAFTLRYLVPRCFRVPLQPGLNGKNSSSFLGLQGAQTLFLNPYSMVNPINFLFFYATN